MMEKKDFEKKLQQGYQEMINHVGDFIDKEGKTLKEAVDAAEDKLSEWGELTREEVLKISDEVRHDVGQFGETWEEAKTYFQQKLSFDAEYLKESLWDKLSGIANNATLDFIEFQKDLQQRVKEKTKTEDNNEYLTWLTEIYLWQQEHKDAEEKLAIITKALQAQGEQLQQHTEIILQSSKEDDSIKMQQQAEIHAKLKKEQKQTITLIDKLYKLGQK